MFVPYWNGPVTATPLCTLRTRQSFNIRKEHNFERLPYVMYTWIQYPLCLSSMGTPLLPQPVYTLSTRQPFNIRKVHNVKKLPYVMYIGIQYPLCLSRTGTPRLPPRPYAHCVRDGGLTYAKYIMLNRYRTQCT
jgi:hypothetical protein